MLACFEREEILVKSINSLVCKASTSLIQEKGNTGTGLIPGCLLPLVD
jgi:hypothetical protein